MTRCTSLKTTTSIRCIVLDQLSTNMVSHSAKNFNISMHFSFRMGHFVMKFDDYVITLAWFTIKVVACMSKFIVTYMRSAFAFVCKTGVTQKIVNKHQASNILMYEDSRSSCQSHTSTFHYWMVHQKRPVS